MCCHEHTHRKRFFLVKISSIYTEEKTYTGNDDHILLYAALSRIISLVTNSGFQRGKIEIINVYAFSYNNLVKYDMFTVLLQMNDTAAPTLFDVRCQFDQWCMECRRSEEEPVFRIRVSQGN